MRTAEYQNEIVISFRKIFSDELVKTHKEVLLDYGNYTPIFEI